MARLVKLIMQLRELLDGSMEYVRIWEILARAINGEVLITHRLVTHQFLSQFFGGYLKGKDFIARKGFQKLVTAKICNLGSLRLGDHADFVPFDGSRQTHFFGKNLWAAP